MAFAAEIPPQNWLECDGAAYLTGSFPDLYAAISSSHVSASYGYLCDSFGNRDATGSYFKMPDFRGEFLRGWDHSRGVDVNRFFGSTQTASLGTHYHGMGLQSNYGGLPAQFLKTAPWTSPDGSWTSMVIMGNGFGGYTGTLVVQSATAPLTNGLITSGPIGTAETRPRNVAVLWCIKYSNSINFATSGSTIAGDVTGTLSNSTVIKLRNIPVASATPSDGDILLYDSASNQWIGGTPNIGGAPGKSYWIANPGFIFPNGDDLYIYNYANTNGRRNLVHVDQDTNIATYKIQWPQDAWNMYGRVFRKTTDNLLHIITFSDVDLYDYDIDNNIVTRITGSGGHYYDLPVKVDWASGSLRPTVWALYGSYNAGANGNSPTFRWRKHWWTGASWTSAFVTNAVDLHGVVNATEYNKFVNYATNPGDAQNALLWDYNYILKRYYLLDGSSGYLHIFQQDTGDIVTNFNTASISYVKTLAVPVPSMDNWQDADAEKFVVDYHPDTGEERGICHTRRGNTGLIGVAAYTYWPEV
jgi:tail collar domain